MYREEVKVMPKDAFGRVSFEKWGKVEGTAVKLENTREANWKRNQEA